MTVILISGLQRASGNDSAQCVNRPLSMANKSNASVRSSLAVSRWTSALHYGLTDAIAIVRPKLDDIHGAPPLEAKDIMLRPLAGALSLPTTERRMMIVDSALDNPLLY
jgi:hypothetical protein